jgi:hypothetical protein
VKCQQNENQINETLMLLCGFPTETFQMSISFCIKFHERAKFITHGASMIKYLKGFTFLAFLNLIFCILQVLQNKWFCVPGAEDGAPLC